MDTTTSNALDGGTVAEALRGFTLLGGDWVLWILILASIVSITVILERAIYFTRNQTPMRKFFGPFADRLRRGDTDGAAALADMTNGAAARVAAEGLRYLDDGPFTVEEVMAGRRIAERLAFERYLMILGTMGNNAPFIGLFGTVLGIIKAFHDLATQPSSTGAPAVMAGISEALVATAMGLLVAIPAVIAYNFFLKKMKDFSANAETIERLVLAHAKSSAGTELRAAAS